MKQMHKIKLIKNQLPGIITKATNNNNNKQQQVTWDLKREKVRIGLKEFEQAAAEGENNVTATAVEGDNSQRRRLMVWPPTSQKPSF